jgi:hypothetical protein
LLNNGGNDFNYLHFSLAETNERLRKRVRPGGGLGVVFASIRR